MTDRARIAIVLAFAVMLAAWVTVWLALGDALAPTQPVGPAQARMNGHPRVGTVVLSAGEGDEERADAGTGVPVSVQLTAGFAIRAYRQLERAPRDRTAWRSLRAVTAPRVAASLRDQPPRPAIRRLPVLRAPFIVATGPRSWAASVVTRRGELYLVLELTRRQRRIVVTDLR